jgi:transcriptional regulator with XRE-family HTH domain
VPRKTNSKLESPRRVSPALRHWADKCGTANMIELGNRIREKRIACGMTAGEAAARAGDYSGRTWWHWEAGERAMGVEQLLAIASVFDCSVNELVADLSIPATHPISKDLQRISMQMLREWWQLPERERNAVRRIIKTLKRREAKNFKVLD